MKTEQPIASICLYGNDEVGAGYLCEAKGIAGVFGEHEPHPSRSRTDAILLGCMAIRARGLTKGKVMVHDAGGERFAVVDLGCPITYGGLKWTWTEAALATVQG